MNRNNPVTQILIFLRDRFSLKDSRDTEAATIASIRGGMEFKGMSVWVLIAAIFIASIGLNVNSTAVIIGAMLVSPLMGPIMGIGLSLGLFDIPLLQRAAKNLAVMVGISLATSTLYFAISPLDEAGTELLARTTPTIWDVFIAFFGGMAGIIAAASKEKGNPIPGVAIATALMPPICTAGYGLATGQWWFFAGALYLFTINAVFISLSTYLIVRLLRFKPIVFPNPATGRRIRRYITFVVLITVLPSTYIAYTIVKATIREENIKSFIRNELQFDETQLVAHKVVSRGDSSFLDLTFVGNPLERQTQLLITSKLPQYNLADLNLRYRQSTGTSPQLEAGLLGELLDRKEQELRAKTEEARQLEYRIQQSKNILPEAKAITEEARAIVPQIKSMALSRAPLFLPGQSKVDTLPLVWVTVASPVTDSTKLRDWLKVRLKSDSILLHYE